MNIMVDFGTVFTDTRVGQVSRREEMVQVMYAILTREHLLLKGKPGTGKSQLAMNAFRLVNGAKTYSAHLTKQTTEEYVFGPLNIDKLRVGELEHNYEGSILDADFAFLDELFDASDVLLRALLGVLNEREWKRGRQYVRCPLRTAILTSNYQRDNDMTDALMDRILFKATVQPLRLGRDRLQVYENYLNGFEFTVRQPLVELSEIDTFYNVLQDQKSVMVSRKLLQSFDRLLDEFSQKSNRYISQRSANRLLKIPKAKALLSGRKEMVLEDLKEVRYGLCELHNHEEETVFDEVYETYVAREEEQEKCQVQLDEVERFISGIPKDLDKAGTGEFIKAMSEINTQKNLLLEGDYPTRKSQQRASEMAAHLSKLIQEHRERLIEIERKEIK